MTGQGTTTPLLDVDAILADRSVRIVVCCGSGGVGKTTTAAALGVRAAEVHGRRTVVLTIDPARRLAQSLGLAELSNTPRIVKDINPANGGELHAMMLDMKRTFDEVVLMHTDAGRAQEIFANPFYQAMSSTFAGTQEYMAMEKLGQLRATDTWDLIVVDTPPSRSALDFLDAPARLSRFLDGRMLKVIMAPARAGGRSMFSIMTASFGLFSKAVQRILGGQLITDLSAFIAGLDTTFGGFRDRAEKTYRILQARETAFLVVAVPERDAIREAGFFAGRLAADRMPLHGLLLNRTHELATTELTGPDALAAAQAIELAGGNPGVVAALRAHEVLAAQVAREHQMAEWFRMEHPEIPVLAIPAQPADVHDIDGLRNIGASFGQR